MKKNREMLQGERIHPRHVQIIINSTRRRAVERPIVQDKSWDRWRLLYGTEGEGFVTWPGESEKIIVPGDAVLLAPNTAYTFNTRTENPPWCLYSASFLPRTHWYEWLKWPELAPGIMHIKVENFDFDRRIRAGFNQATELAEGPHARWEEFAMAALELILLTFDEINPLSQKEHTDSRLQKAIEFMDQHLGEKLTREQIARAAAVSSSYLGVLFQEHIGIAPLQYLDRLRIDKAQRLLRQTTETISRIGYMVGYRRLNHFCRRFREITGLTPGTYRKALK